MALTHLFLGEDEKERNIQSKLAKIIIYSSDPEELKNKIVKEVAIALKANSCSFIEYDSTTDSFKKITNSFNSKRGNESFIGFDFQKELPSYTMKMKYMNEIVVKNADAYIKKEGLEGSVEAKFMSKYKIKSFVAVRLGYGDNFLGMLMVHFDYAKPFLRTIDEKFLVNIAEHISIALHLSKLYVEEKRKKEKEQLLRYLITIMNEDYDLKKITGKIFEILGRMFDAQSIFIKVNTENLKDSYFYNLLPYKSNVVEACMKKAVISIYNFKELESVKNKEHYIKDTYNFVLQNNLENHSINKYFKRKQIKSLVYLPLINENNNYGHVIIHFGLKNPLTDDDKNFIETVIDQLAIVVNQSNLYEKQRKNAGRECLLRRVTEKIRSSLDLEKTLSYICEETAKVFDVQRAVITKMTDPGKQVDIVLLKEYQSSPEIKGLFKTDYYQPVAKYWNYDLLNDSDVIAIDNIQDSEYPDFFKKAYESINIKSILGAAIKEDKYKETWGSITLSAYFKTRNWNEEEKLVLSSIANQIYIAIKQADLFSSLKKSAERETLLRKIFETMRQTLDPEVIKQTIVTEIGKALNANACFLAIKPENEAFYVIDSSSEYLSSEKEISSINLDTSSDDLKWFKESLDKRKEINFPKVEDFITENKLQGTPEEKYLKERNIKSSYTIPISFGKNLAYIILHYTNDYRKLDNSEMDFLRLIAVQAGIALEQANLYQTTQYQAEREKINRSILEILRNSLEKDVIKSLFVKNIGKFFNADRVFFIDYDPDNKIFLPVEPASEYRSNPEVKSIVGLDWDDSSMNEYIKILQDKREFKIPCWNEYSKENNNSEELSVRFEDSDIYSSYSLPVLYEGKLFGYFCVEYTGEKCNKLSNEDIIRIRNLCTQAGIALYHSELFKKSQESSVIQYDMMQKVCNKITTPLKEIIETGKTLIANNGKDEIANESLEKIVSNGEEILKLKESVKQLQTD